MIINAENKAIWVDKGQPAGVHDYRCIWRSNLEQKANFKKDKFISDLGYRGSRIRVHFLTPYPEPKTGELNNSKKRFNYELRSLRVKIEHWFGMLKRRFHLLREYRGPIEILPSLFLLACAFLNQLIDGNDIREEEWEEARNEINIEELQEDDPYDGELDVREQIGRQQRVLNPREMEQQEWDSSEGRLNLPQDEFEKQIRKRIEYAETRRREQHQHENETNEELQRMFREDEEQYLTEEEEEDDVDDDFVIQTNETSNTRSPSENEIISNLIKEKEEEISKRKKIEIQDSQKIQKNLEMRIQELNEMIKHLQNEINNLRNKDNHSAFTQTNSSGKFKNNV